MFCVFIINKTVAQDLSTPVGYMNYINDQQHYMMQKSWNYMHTAAHSFDIDQITKAQQELIRAVEKSLEKIKEMPAYNGNTTYRDATVAQLENNIKVFRKEYKDMIDLKEVTLTSFNALENYLQLKELANEKLDEYYENFKQAHRNFAAQNNITLIDFNSELSQKIKKSVEVIEYKDQLHLNFFESYIAEINIIESLKHEDATLLKQLNNKLIAALEKGVRSLKDKKPYNNDDQLIVAVRSIFDFYKEETTKHIPVMINYFETKERFLELEKLMKKTPQKKLTQKRIDDYNKSVEEINKVGKDYNVTQTKLNELRSNIVLNWNVLSVNFLDTHIPKEGI